MLDQTTFEKLEEMHDRLIGIKCRYVRNGLKTGIIKSILIDKDGVFFTIVDNKTSHLIHEIRLDKIKEFKYEDHPNYNDVSD